MLWRRRLGLVLLALGCLSGCLRRPSNGTCDWPPDPRSGPLDLNHAADRDHLREDIETAEDLAVRFMDAHGGATGGLGQAASVRSQCFVKLSSIVVAEHRLTPHQYMSFVGRRPPGFDAAVGISWMLLYAWAASGITARMWRRYGPGGLGGSIMIAYVSLVAAGLAVLGGEQWAGLCENLRLGNGHLSYRLDRVPWGHHRVALFAGALTLFWVIAALRFRTPRFQCDLVR